MRVATAESFTLYALNAAALPPSITAAAPRGSRFRGRAPTGPVYDRPPMAYRVTLIRGDGTGPELTEATRRVLEATGVAFDWDVQEAGADTMDKHDGNPLPPHVLDAVREAGVALKGPITTPVGKGFRSVNVALRKELDMYGQVRPIKSYPGVRSRFQDVDLIVVRENTEDLYAGVEYDTGTPEAKQIIDMAGGKIRPDCDGRYIFRPERSVGQGHRTPGRPAATREGTTMRTLLCRQRAHEAGQSPPEVLAPVMGAPSSLA